MMAQSAGKGRQGKGLGEERRNAAGWCDKPASGEPVSAFVCCKLKFPENATRRSLISPREIPGKNQGQLNAAP